MEEFCPGDTIGILTQNLPSDVAFVLDRLHLAEIADCCFEVKLAKPVKKKNPEIPPYIPKFITPRRLLTECIDFRIIPRKVRFVRSLVASFISFHFIPGYPASAGQLHVRSLRKKASGNPGLEGGFQLLQ